MDAERARGLLLKLPHVVETAQWGGIVFWVGDKAIGGKMFAMVNPVGAGDSPISLMAGAERYYELLELEGVRPAPYLARAFWVAMERWDVLRDAEWITQFAEAQRLVAEKLPARVRKTLELPKAELKRVVAERRKVIAAKAVSKG